MPDQPITETLPVDYWRSLRYFTLYRLALAGILVFIAGVYGQQLLQNARNWKLFIAGCLVYALVAALSFVPLKLRWPRFTWQLAIQVGGDIVCLMVLSYASGGIQGSVGLLLLVSLAAAGLISRGRVTLFFAALASIAALLEHSYAVVYADADAAQFVQVGLQCVAYFAVAWLAHTLARYAVDSELLALRRGRALVSLTEANRLVMRDMQDGVLVVDGQGNIMQMNQGAERLLRKGAVSGSLLSEAFPILYGQYTQWKNTGRASQDILQLDMGLQARLRFVAIEEDAALGAVIFLEDMQRIQAEAQQIKLAALGRLTANIAHEVRNPLSAISYATELLQEGAVDEKQQRLLQIVLDNTHRINQIVQDVMQLNRRDRASPELLDLGALLHAFAEEFELAERLTPGILVLQVDHARHIEFDRGHLRQILWNLCSNALRYGRREAGSVKLAVSDMEGRSILDIMDDGPGVPVEQLGKLFEPFFTTAPEGTGLGLYIAKELCEANGARLEYHSAAGAGACFRIAFGERNRTLTG